MMNVRTEEACIIQVRTFVVCRTIKTGSLASGQRGEAVAPPRRYEGEWWRDSRRRALWRWLVVEFRRGLGLSRSARQDSSRQAPSSLGQFRSTIKGFTLFPSLFLFVYQFA